MAISISLATNVVFAADKNLHKQAMRAMSAGQLNLAEELERNALKENPNDAVALEGLAIIYAQQEKYDEAITAAKQALQLNPNSFSNNFNLAELNLSMDKPARALHFYNKALQINPSSVPALIGKANSLTQLGNPLEALDFLEKINASNNPQLQLQLAKIYFSLGDMDQAEATAQSILREKSNDYQAKLLIAQINFERRNLPAAILLSNELIKSDPTKSGAYVLLSECFVATHSGLYNAIDLVKSAKQSATQKSYVLSKLAQAFDRQAITTRRSDPDYLEKRYAWHTLAEECWRQAVLVSPNDAELRYKYALDLRKSRKFVEAYYQINKSLELNPDNKHALLIKSKLKQSKYDLFGWLRFYLDGGDR